MKKCYHSIQKVIFSLLLISFQFPGIFAQTGPGGVGNSDGSGGNPANVIWLDAASLGLSDGNDITTWMDMSGNANDFSVASTFSPIFRNAAPVNGRPYAEFSKSNNRIVLNPFNGMPSSEVTTLIVYRTTDSGDGLISYATGGQSNEFLLFNNSSLNTYIENSNHNSSVAYNAGSWQIMSHRWQSSDGDLRYFLNGVQQASTTHRSGSTMDAGGSLAIGGEQDAVDGGYDAGQAFQGDIAELIMYDAYLNDAQRTIIENYLSARYNISIGATDHYAGDNIRNYEYGVIGIGREANGSMLTNQNTGLVIAAYAGSLDVNGEYVFAGHDNKTNTVSVDSLGAGIQERWLKSWYLDKTASGTLGVTITFDLSDGIAGQYPGNTADYELLKLDLGSTETYDVVSVAGKSVSGDQITFDVADANFVDGFYTLGTTDAVNSPVDGVANTSWYSYKTGDWNDPLTWTTDPSGATRTPSGGGIPGNVDDVEILSGRTVTMVTDNITAGALVVIGNLVVNTTSGHTFSSISGIGTIRISGAIDDSDNFPDGDASGFADALNGGTLEINGDGINLDQTREFRNVFVDLDDALDIALLTANWTINGTLDVNQGTLQINDGTAGQNLTVNAYGDVSVQTNASFAVGNGNARHQLNFYGNFINSGTAKFTNRVAANYGSEATDGIVDVNFLSDDSDQTIDCLGPTVFYRIEIDKGDDQTYILDINASSSANFSLFGPADYGHGNIAQLTTNDNSLGLLRGTVRINNNVIIPVLNNAGNYNISTAARLWVNGGSVTKPSGSAIVPYGTVRVSSGSLSAPVTSGLTTRDNGNIVVEGGVITTNQIRTSVLGQQNIGGYTQSGGTVNVTGGSINRDYYTFSLTYAGNTFNMSGGTLKISGSAALQDNSGTSGQVHGGALFINSAAGNYNVTGGDIIIDNTTAVNAKISSTAPLWNLTVTNSGGSAAQVELDEGTSGDDQPGEFETILNPTLRILNNFTIEAGVVFDHNGYDVEIGSDFIIEDNADYVWDNSKRNTTTMNGVDNSVMAFYNRDDGTSDEQRFWNFIIDKPSDKTVSMASNKTAGLGGTANNLLRIDGDAFKVLSGTLDQGYHSIRVYTDTLVNYDVITVFDPANNPSNGINDQIKFRPDNFVLLTADTSRFGNVRLNNGNRIVTLISDLKIDYLEYLNGRMNLQDHNLTIDVFEASPNQDADNGTCTNCYSVSDMFMTNGKASDGGLSIYIPSDGLNPWNGSNVFLFPFGIGDDRTDATGVNSRYTPATITINGATDDGYITIRPVDRVLATTDGTGGEILSYYWRVNYEGFSALPNIDSYQFVYYDNDLDGGVNEALFVPGKVLEVDPYSRSSEVIANMNTTTNVITFNGNTGGGATPFAVEDASYTAGEPARFVGAPTIYYSRNTSQKRWTDNSAWSLTRDGASAGAHPGSGDIAILTRDNGGAGDPTGYGAGVFLIDNSTGPISIAKLVFDDYDPVNNNWISGCPRVIFDAGGGYASYGSNFGTVEVTDRHIGGPVPNNSHGAVMQYNLEASYAGIFPGGDFGDFNSYENALVIYSWDGGTGAATLSTAATEYPMLWFAGGNSNNRYIQFPDADVTVNGRANINGGMRILVNDDASRTLTFKNNVEIGSGCCGEGFFEFEGNSAGNQTVVVEGNLSFNATNGGQIRLINNSGTNEHKLIAKSDISISAAGTMNLGNGSNSVVDLELQGETDNTFTNLGAATFHRIIMNKGASQANTFSFDDNFSLTGATNGTIKAVEILNGTLVFNDPAINVDLTSGDTDFVIPNTGALRITQGTAKVRGDDTGIALNGSLVIEGGTLDMDDAVGNGNNYIEYGSGGAALLEISDGTLDVGAQIRPITSAETGVLKYRQTGGDVRIGTQSAPENSRGMLQIYNTGSEFTYTGGTLTIERHQTSPAVAALYLNPDDYDVTGSTITIFNGNTPAGQSDFRINSTIPLNNLLINDTNAPTVRMNINPLEIEGTLTLNANATFDAQGLTLTLLGDMLNDGVYVPNGNTTFFGASATQALSGSGTFNFFNLTKNATGTLSLSSGISVAGTLFIEEGAIDDGGNSITTAGNVIVDGTHSSSGGSGIVFAGSGTQQLSRSGSGTGVLGTITINNANGVEIPDGNGYNFDINGDLRLQNGVLNIGGALVSISSTGDIIPVSPFGLSNMVQTNSSFTDNGLKKNFPAGYGTDFIFPIGQLVYTPVIFDFSSGSNTFGSTAGSITVRPANEYHPTIDDGSNFFASGDINNVLQYHWIINADNINGFSSSVDFYYDQSDVKTDEPGYTEADYLAASILSDNNPTNTINKFDVADVDETANIITFTLTSVTDEGISGDYFAGIDEAIPDNVATYTSVMDGDVDAAIYDIPVPGGGAPRGAVLVVATGTTVTLNINDVSLYKTEIQSGGTLEVAETDGHRLGTVSGTGNLKLVSSTSSVVLPAGFYGDFFSCTGGGLEYAGTGSYDILGGIPNIRNLTLSGSGDRNFPNTNVTVCEDLVVDGPTIFFNQNRRINVLENMNLIDGIFNAPAGTDSRVNIFGNLDINGGQFICGSAGRTSVVSSINLSTGSINVGTANYIFRAYEDFNFTAGSFVGGTGNSIFIFFSSTSFDFESNISGDFTGANSFYNLEIDKGGTGRSISLNSTINISNKLNLIDGVVNANGNNLVLGDLVMVSPTAGQESSYVNGRVVKTLASAGDDFIFPIGGPTRYRPAYVQDVSTGGLAWEAEYFETTPTAAPEVSNLTPADAAILTMSTEEYWRISDGQGAGSANAVVGLSWGTESYVSANAAERQQLRVMVWNETNSNWDNAGGANYSGGNTQDFGMFNSSGAVTFSEKIFTLGSTDLSNPLPVELVSFTGREQEGQVLLKWETASEQNNDYFLIEHSVDGKTFVSIGEAAGAGTISSTQYYNFAHRNPAYPDNYYRLKQVDFDGAFEYSDVILVRLDSELGPQDIDFLMYPNPTTQNTVNIRLRSADYSKPVVIEVVSLSGRLMYQERYDVPDFNEDIAIDFGHHAVSGIYMVRLVQADKAVVKKLILK